MQEVRSYTFTTIIAMQDTIENLISDGYTIDVVSHTAFATGIEIKYSCIIVIHK